jgi:AraC family transcriptional regulator
MVDVYGNSPLSNQTAIPSSLESVSLTGRCACTERDEVCVNCIQARPCEILPHRHPEVQILITPESAEWEAAWQDHRGDLIQRKIYGSAIWLLPPKTGHSAKWLRESTLIALQIDPGWAERIASGVVAYARVEPLRGCTTIDPIIAALTAELYRIGGEFSQSVTLQKVALGHCLAARLLHVFSRGLSIVPSPVQRQLGPERLAKVVEFIEKHYSEHITQAMLAREACLSAGHFGVLFKATTGVTPEQYVLRTRLLRAKSLIESGSRTVSEVAYMTGFSDHSHFTTQFKRLFGTPPRTFLPSVRRV